MHYVFFETGNPQFLDHLMRIYCQHFAERIIEAYNIYKKGKDGVLDHTKTESYLKDKCQIVTFLHCDLFNGVQCRNTECNTEHTAVLASNQMELISRHKAAILKRLDKQDPGRRWVQNMFQCRDFVESNTLEIFILEEKNDHTEYLRLYLQSALHKKRKAGGCVYVRADTPSDYDIFKGSTELKDIVACTALQKAT
jgi:hypothetical protein